MNATIEKFVEMAEALVVVRLLEVVTSAGPVTLLRDTDGGWEIRTTRPDGGSTWGGGSTLQEAARNYASALAGSVRVADRLRPVAKEDDR